jgi:hypothetical protein
MSSKTIMNCVTGRDMEEVVMNYFKVLSQHTSGYTKGKYKKLSQDSRWPAEI